MAASNAFAALLKNDNQLLPATSPASVLLAGDMANNDLATALQHEWPDCVINRPTTRNPVRLQTLARRQQLVLLCVRLDAAAGAPSRQQLALIDKLGKLRQTLLLLPSDTPRALGQWHRQLACLLWTPQHYDAPRLAQLLAGKRPAERLPFPLPFNARHVADCGTDGWQMQAGRQPAFPAGHGLLTDDR